MHNNPKSIQHIPDAIPLIATHETTKKDALAPEALDQFDVLPLEKCLALLQEVFLSNSTANQFALLIVNNGIFQNINNVIFYLPQLVALRNDPSDLFQQFVLYAARNDLTMAHQLIWLCQSESFEGEDGIHGEQNDFCNMKENLVYEIETTFDLIIFFKLFEQIIKSIIEYSVISLFSLSPFFITLYLQ